MSGDLPSYGDGWRPGGQRTTRPSRGSTADISVDGGVDAANAPALVQAGATILVAGASIFGAPDPVEAAHALRAAALAAR